MHIARNPKAAQAARPFLEAIFQAPGTLLSTAEMVERAITAKIDASPSLVQKVAHDLAREGFLERPQRGFFKRPDPKGTPLEIPASEAPAAAPESIDLLRVAGLDGRLARIEKLLEAGVVIPALDATDLTTAARIVADHLRSVSGMLDANGRAALTGLVNRLNAAAGITAPVNGSEAAHG